MTIADDDQNPIPAKKLTKSLDTIAALRAAMEQRLAEVHKTETMKTESPRNFTPPPSAVNDPPPDDEPEEELPEETSDEKPAEQIEALSPPPDVVEAPAPRNFIFHAEPDPIPEPPPVFESAPHPQPEPEPEPQPELESEPTPREEVKEAPQAAQPRGEEKAAPPNDPAEWPRILFRIADRTQKLLQDFMERNKNLAPDQLPIFDPAHISEAFYELLGRIVNDPERFAEAQLALWQGYVQIWQSTLARMQGKPTAPVVTPSPSDKRFQDKDWQNVWVFDYLKQSYLLTAQWTNTLVRKESEKLDPRLAQKLEFYTRQMVDAISPSNFWMTNPEVLRTTLESGGENLIKGFENLLSDLERGHGQLRINMSDAHAFKVGKNLATTPGKVVFQNDLMQLIQYEPRTTAVYKTPLLIIPPWINKYYILDLREKNSFIRHLTEQGYTVFCISWVNPSTRHALVNFDDYMVDGAFAAMREVKRITSENDINVLGYCIGGTLLATALAYLKAAPAQPEGLPNVKSATYLVTMIDFAEPGDLGVFMDEDQIKAIEARMAKQGYLDAASMATTFNLLRSNDLIWSFVVNNYLLGREPFPFDILYWNSDSTNLPAVMQSYYLRKMYIANKLVEPNGLQMKDVPIDVRSITTPSFLLATHDDHIAPWRSTYAATQLYAGSVKFVLAGSGHIAGVINPPAANKYGYWTNDACPADAEEWFSNAEQHSGSWWPEWLDWLKSYAGDQVPARAVPEGIENAPGSYVKIRAV
jgi:polyhydroxyalkanoate synthase